MWLLELSHLALVQEVLLLHLKHRLEQPNFLRHFLLLLADPTEPSKDTMQTAVPLNKN
jgi:hypothetical protein